MATSHRFLIGPPLFVISLFCFGFVLMHPHNPIPAGAATSSHSSLQVSNKTEATVTQASQANLQKLSPAPLNSSTVSVTAGTSVSSTGSAASQASNTGATATLQSASPNNQTTAGGDKTTQALRTTVTNLFNSSLKLIR
jgi:phage-related tail fiber protein